MHDKVRKHQVRRATFGRPLAVIRRERMADERQRRGKEADEESKGKVERRQSRQKHAEKEEGEALEEQEALGG